MKNNVKKLLIILLCFMAIRIYTHPENKARRFVNRNRQMLEQKFENNESIPFIYGCKKHSHYSNMEQFTLSTSGFASGTGYYGCYYSPDDIPFAFQNSGIQMIPDENNVWHWAEENGDNHGLTYKIQDKWYYFEAHF